ncbi:MAG TPA: DNA repair protein RadC [Burkholderiaceae bacterium]|nr:DNA repair protein RadC [Burkholderiaceae bacterium]
MPITDWPESDRPREKMLRHGAAALSDAELLAVLLRVGVAGKSAVDLARELLSHFGSISTLMHATPEEVARIKGLGPAKALQFQAALQLARRALDERLREPAALTNPTQVADFLRLELGGDRAEVFMVLFLDAQNRLIRAERMFTGTLTQTSVYPREVVKAALLHHAAGVILAHNHPSGVAEPSDADVALTSTLRAALALVDVRVLDHFVVTAGQARSMAQAGLI